MISASTLKPFSLSFSPQNPKFIAIYTDASHNLKTGRAHCGSLIQLQATNNPEIIYNVVSFHSERLAKLYNSVYAAEIKAIENGIKQFLIVYRKINLVFKDLKGIVFNDNKAAVLTLTNGKEPHPFVSDSVDIVKQLLGDNHLSIHWVNSEGNLADCLTKPQKWF